MAASPFRLLPWQAAAAPMTTAINKSKEGCCNRTPRTASCASMEHVLKMKTVVDPGMLRFEETRERIKKLFNGDKLSVSSYDTAWVAMVPSLNSPEAPCFPQCVKWLLDNQLHDGSWGLPHFHPDLLKDAILSTLASVLALKRWNVGEEQINMGLRFLELNFASSTDENQHSPVGFDIIFPGMAELAKDMDLNLPIRAADLNAILYKRDLELKRAHGENCEGREAYLAYVSEGLGKLQDWEMVMKHQRKNGSLFNSPSTTAAALIHVHNVNCLSYLDSVLEKFGHAVPTVHPLGIYTSLWMVDVLERLGIDQYFKKEIQSLLDKIYESWLNREEEIFLDIATCAMAFRVLRFNRYDVSSDQVSQFAEEDYYFSSLSGHVRGMGTALELFRASELAYPDESALEKLNLQLSSILEQDLSSAGLVHVERLNNINEEVKDALMFPFHANLERLKNKRNIENYNVVDTRVLKASYCSSILGNEDFLKLALENFNMCQSKHLEELKHLERWAVDSRLDQLTFARKKLAYCYFSAAATIFTPELSEARISWAKNGLLTTVVDDFFDIGGSKEELENLIALVEKWDANLNVDCCSEKVEIIYSALYSTICEIEDKAFGWQARSVRSHIIEIWLGLMKSMLREAEWVRNKSAPTMEEYMTNGYVSFALGPIVLPALYFIGPKLSEEVVQSNEFHDLFRLMSTCGRLLNDIQTVKREAKEGKLNAVLLHNIPSGGAIIEEEIVKEMRGIIDRTRRELLKMVLEGKDSVVPGACKDVFWKMSKVVHYFYMKDDGFSSHELIEVVNALIYEPLVFLREERK